MSAAFRIGYASAGLAGHRLEDALRVLAELGYQAVLLTLDTCHLDPFAPDALTEAARVRRRLDDLGLTVAVETGARYLLDRHRKHEPTLVSSEGFERRFDYLRRSLRIATILGARVVSLWSGAREPRISPDQAWGWLETRLAPLVQEAQTFGLTLAFEPEPGMLVETVQDFHALRTRLGSPPALRLSLDCGHLLVTGEGLPGEVLRREREWLALVAIEDMRHRVHEHLPFGEGDLDLPELIIGLRDSAFSGIVAVELGRHSHEGPKQALRSREILAAHGVSFGPSPSTC